MSLGCNEGCKDLDYIMKTHRQWYVVAKLQRTWKNSSHRKKRIRKVDLLVIKLSFYKGKFPNQLGMSLLARRGR